MYLLSKIITILFMCWCCTCPSDTGHAQRDKEGRERDVGGGRKGPSGVHIGCVYLGKCILLIFSC